jgi:type IV pilus assembly protein PilA
MASISGNYVSQVEVGGSGLITATFGSGANPAIRTQTLTLQGTDNVGSVEWECGGTIAAKYRPASCRN